jgi:hypothetical protein
MVVDELENGAGHGYVVRALTAGNNRDARAALQCPILQGWGLLREFEAFSLVATSHLQQLGPPLLESSRLIATVKLPWRKDDIIPDSSMETDSH